MGFPIRMSDWRWWEIGLFTAAAALFAAAAAANMGPLFFAGGRSTVAGAVCSYLYLVAWALAAGFLKDRAAWVYTAFAVRCGAVLFAVLAIAVSAGNGYGLLSAACVMPYAVFVSVYGGLFEAAWVYYFLLLVQAGIATILFFRLRRKRRAAEEDYPWA